MKYTKYIGMMFVAGSLLAATSCTEFSDYNSVVGDVNTSADKTLWENISGSENLQDFAKILKKAGFDKTLSASQFYTVWAPLDGTYDADAVYAQDSATIVKQFVKQHVAEFNHLLSGEVEDDVLTLNLKSHKFTNTTFGESELSTANLPSSNGVMHTLKGIDPFYFSIYEFIENMSGSSFRDYITKFDRQEIDPATSILGPIVNGQQTYQHIEYKTVNDVISNVLWANLENEDSVYTMLAPNDRAWAASYARISPNFKYVKGMAYSDLYNNGNATNTTVASSIAGNASQKTDIKVVDEEHLQDSLTTWNMVRNLVYSHGVSQNDKLNAADATETDTIVPTFSSRIGLNNARKFPSAKAVQDYTVGEVQRMSNGYFREIDSLCFNSWDTFEPVIKTRSVARAIKSTPAGYNHNIRDLIKERSWYAAPDSVMRDSIFANMPAYFYEDLLGDKRETFSYVVTSNITSNSASPELDIMLDGGVLSTKYRVYVVMVPIQMDAPTINQKPYYLNFYMMYTDAENKPAKKLLNLAEDADPAWGPQSITEKIGSKNVTSVVTQPGMVNVVDLGEFEFPLCYYGTDAYPTLLIAHTQTYGSQAKRDSYEQAMRVARVYLVPAEYDKLIDKRLIKDIKE